MLRLDENNYYSAAANKAYWSVSQYKDMCKCEAAALAKMNGTFKEPMTKPMLVGSWVDAYFEGTLDGFIKDHREVVTFRNELRAEFKKANEIIARLKADELFMKFMSGRKQEIMTFEMFGVPWKMKMDSYIPDMLIADLKVVANFKNLALFRYDLQGAVYVEGVRSATGQELPFFLAVATKEKVVDLDIFQIRKANLNMALREIEGNIGHFEDVKRGFTPPTCCGHCNYCKSIKRARVRDYNELLEG